MKVLYITTIGGTMTFFKSFIKQLIDKGHIVDIATNEETSIVPSYYREWGCQVCHIDTTRSPIEVGNIKAIGQIERIVEKGKYDIVHCHTPIAAACTRIACRTLRKKGVKVFYTAHGFHFYKGAPLKNWLIYFPVEKFCAHFTDTLITINKEDYDLAKKKMQAKRVVYVPGVGIDLKKFGHTNTDKAEKRKELGIPDDATLLLSVGELNANKNHEIVIRAIEGLDFYYLIAGEGYLHEHLQNVIDEQGLSNRVKLLGYRTDVAELYKAADLYILPSIREGLNVSLMEAMASGLPVVCGKIRGNVELIDAKGGALFEPQNVNECKESIEQALCGDMTSLGRYNQEKVCAFSIEEVNRRMKEIYGMSFF